MKLNLQVGIILFITLLPFFFSRTKFRTRVTKSKRFTKYMNRFTNYPLKIERTSFNDWGESNTIYLDRHHVNCGTGALNSFHLQRNTKGDKIKYDYTCLIPKHCTESCHTQIKAMDEKLCQNLRTPLNTLASELGKSTNDLSKHNIRCPKDHVLTGFKFARESPKVFYEYRCCPAKVGKCQKMDTGLTDYGDFGHVYLDRQHVKVPEMHKQALTGFLLKTNDHKHSYFYHVEYCDITG